MPAIVPRHLLELVALALGLAALWRAEVTWHGWAGLTWIGYPHLAVPAGATLFLAWLARTSIVAKTGRRFGLLGIAAVYAALSLYGYALCMRMGLQRFGSREAFLLSQVIAFSWPLLAFAAGRVTGHRLPWSLLAASCLLVWTHWPVGAVLAGDAIHAVKTGAAVIPFVLGMGLPWCAAPPEST